MPARKSLASEDNFRKLEAALRAGFWSYDLRSGAIEWSPGFYALFGLKPEVVLPDVSVAASLVHPEDRQAWGDILSLAKKSRKSARTARIIRPDGQMIWVQSYVEGQFDRGGALASVHGVMIDISEQQVEREDMRRDRNFVLSLRRLTRGSFWRAAADGKLMDVGDWVRITGETPEQAGDWDALAAVHPEDRDTFRAAWQAGISRKAPISFTARVRDQQGKYVAYENRAIPIEDEHGQIAEWHGFSHPVTAPAAREAADLTSAQIRAARALLDWTGPELAERSGVSFSTIKRLEKSEDAVKPDSIKRVRATLEQAGIRFGGGADGEVSVALVTQR